MHLVIVAGGLGSRLAPLTDNIPKFLVNIGKETGFVEQIRYWKQYSPDSITVIVHSAYADLVKAYHDLYFKNSTLYVKTVDVANGSAHAIFSTCDHLLNQPVLFTWCDVLPAKSFDIEKLNGAGAVVFTNYDHPNRYDLVKMKDGSIKPELRADGRGGVFGMYYVSTYRPREFKDGQDFVEIVDQYGGGSVRELEIPKIIDFGDKPKLEQTRATADGARSFNSVEMHGDLVLKSALNDQGKTLIGREIAWYSKLDEVGCKARRPHVWTGPDSFVMSRVKGKPIWQVWPTLDGEARALVMTRLFEQLDHLHMHKDPVGNNIIQRDVKIEAYDKLLARYDEIKDVIAAFGPITVVNGMPLKISDPRETISRLYEELSLCYSSAQEHSLIHGDLQMSNSMIDPDTLEVTLIDPRGYFGKSELYGVADYDLAKLRYSLSGYDLFNYSHTFSISKPQPDHICFEIPKPDVTGCGNVNMRFKYVHELWLAVCWIGLAQYIKNDPVKSVAAHYHGLALAEDVLLELTCQHREVTDPRCIGNSRVESRAISHQTRSTRFSVRCGN